MSETKATSSVKDLSDAELGANAPKLSNSATKARHDQNMLDKITPAVQNNVPMSLTNIISTGHFGNIRYDEFAMHLVIEGPDGAKPLQDWHITEIRDRLFTENNMHVRRVDLRDALEAAGRKNSYDSCKDWLAGLPQWDAVPRIAKFLYTYFSTQDKPYHEAVSRYWWTAMVARIVEPGAKADMVPTLVSLQGVGKSWGFELIAPSPDHIASGKLTGSENVLTTKLLGKTMFIWEERAGIAGRLHADEVKTFITQRFIERLDRKSNRQQRILRRFIIVATSNRDDFLRDPTGHRRDLPVEIGLVDREALGRDREQLWAEAKFIVEQRRAAGETLVDFKDADRLAKREHAKFSRQGQWSKDADLKKFLKSQGPQAFTMADALAAVRVTNVHSQALKNEMAYSLRALGYDQTRARGGAGGGSLRAWKKV